MRLSSDGSNKLNVHTTPPTVRVLSFHAHRFMTSAALTCCQVLNYVHLATHRRNHTTMNGGCPMFCFFSRRKSMSKRCNIAKLIIQTNGENYGRIPPPPATLGAAAAPAVKSQPLHTPHGFRPAFKTRRFVSRSSFSSPMSEKTVEITRVLRFKRSLLS